MNRKLILWSMIMSIGFTCAFIMSSQNDANYWQKFKDYVAESRIGKWWAEGERLDPEGRKRLRSVWEYGRKGGMTGLTLGGIGGFLHGLQRSDQVDVMFAGMAGALGGAASLVIMNLWNDYNKGRISREAVIAKINSVINRTIANRCPTRNTKLAMLEDIDYFAVKLRKYATTNAELESQRSLIEEALKQSRSYVMQMWPADTDEDKRIDNEIKKIESKLTGDIKQKIEQLDTDTFKAQAYLLFKLRGQKIISIPV